MECFKDKIPVILITGYLGAGKTTLLNRLLHQEDRKVAVVVNDMGQVNIDAKLVSNDGAAAIKTQMVELSNGCICCTLRDEFMDEIRSLSKQEGLEGIFVEASGVSDPASIAEAFLLYENADKDTDVYLSSIITVVDADRIYNEFLADIEKVSETDTDPDIINLILDQIEFCTSIILNKCDLLDKDKLNRVKAAIRSIQPEAEIIECVEGNIDEDRILNGQKFDYERAMNSSVIQKTLKNNEDGKDSDSECGITSFVFEEKKAFDRAKFMQFLEMEFPEEIIRTKGYIWFKDDPVHVHLVETAGRNASVTEYSNWVDSFDEDYKKEVFDNYPEVLEEWDETYGDRMNQIVFIGKKYDKAKISRDLEACIVC